MPARQARTAFVWGLLLLAAGLLLASYWRAYPRTHSHRPPPGALLYRRVPLDLEAERWWPGNPARNARLGVTEYSVGGHAEATLATLEGPARVVPGAWIVTGIEGERWPVAARVFRQTYRPVIDGRAVEW